MSQQPIDTRPATGASNGPLMAGDVHASDQCPQVGGFVIESASTAVGRRRRRMFALGLALVAVLLGAGSYLAMRSLTSAPAVVPAAVAFSGEVRAAGVGIPDSYRFDVLAAGYAACSAIERGTSDVEMLQAATSYGLGGLMVNATQGDAIIRAAHLHLCPAGGAPAP